MKRLFTVCLTLCVALTMIQAVPVSPKLLKQLLEQGDTARYEQLIHRSMIMSSRLPQHTLRERALQHVANNGARKEFGVTPLMASRGLLILANFSDKSFQASNSKAQIDSMMNAYNYAYNGATGSAAQYFSDQSNGQYRPHFDVVGPITLPKTMSYYGSNGNQGEGGDLKFGDFVLHCCSIASKIDGVNLADYDSDGDGEMDFVYIIYAGKGEADSYETNALWPASYDMASAVQAGYTSLSTSASSSNWTFDGVRIGDFAYSGELNGQSGTRNGIGTPTHEFSHVLGLPDFYDTEYGSNYENGRTPGDWDIMDGGAYNNSGMTPPNMSPWEKHFMGWLTPVNPGSTAQHLTLAASGTDGYVAYQLNSGNNVQSATTSGTMYYIENRQLTSKWDSGLPGHGLLIWKVNYNRNYWVNNEPNTTGGSYNTSGVVSYTLASATGKTTNIGTGADPFPGTGNKTTWTGLSGKPLKNIAESNGVITLDYIDVPTSFTVTWKVNGSVVATQTYEPGDALQMPTVTVTPCEGTTFIGWTADKDFCDPFTNPSDLFNSAAGKTVSANATYHALFK